MPRGKHLPIATAKEQRMYEHILREAKRSGRYKGREKEVAARTVRAKRNPSLKEMYEGKAGWKMKRFADEVFDYARSKDKTTEERMQLIDAGLNAGIEPPRLKRLLAKSIGQKTAIRLVNMRIQQRAGKRNPTQSKGKKALRTTGRAVKGAARGLLSAGSKILGAGAEALNPFDPAEYKRLMSEGRKLEKQAEKLSAQAGEAWRKLFASPQSSDEAKHWNREGRRLEAEALVLRKAADKLYDKAETMKREKRGLNPSRKRKNKTIIKARTIKHLDVSKVHNPRRQNKTPHISEADISKLSPAAQQQLRAQLEKVEEKESKAATPAQHRAAAKSRRSFLSRLGTRLKVIGQTRKYKVSARNLNKAPRKTIKVRARHETDAIAKAQAKLGSGFDQFRVQNVTRHRAGNPTYTVSARKKIRKRNLDHKDSAHQVKVHQHWRAGGLSQWQRAHHAGQQGLFAHGIKARAKRNASAFVGNVWAYHKTEKRWHKVPIVQNWLNRKRAIDAARRELKRLGKLSAYSKFKALPIGSSPNPSKAIKSRRRNQSPDAIRKEFAGSVSGSRDLYFPQGTPQGLAKLGKLVSIKTEEGTLKPVSGTAWLVCDTKGKLHIGTTQNKPLWDGQAHSFGAVKEVEYESAKPHLGFPNPIVFYHKLGEETGRKPTLHADGKGGLRFQGGAYKITREGIVD